MATWEDVRSLALELPEATELPPPSLCFSVRKRWFVAMSTREEDAIVVRVDLDERPLLIESDPRVYFLTPHYERGRYLLVRLSRVATDELRDRLLDSWLAVAPKRLAATLELD